MRRSPTAALFVLFLALAAASCGVDAAAPAERPSYTTWPDAERMWRAGDVTAYQAWRSLDPEAPEGREAADRLSSADAHYREGIRRLEAGEEGVREALERGVAVAPMNPEHYLRLARACRAREIELRAAEYYAKYLAAFPSGPDSAAAREELSSLDPELAGLFDPPEPVAPPEAPPPPAEPPAVGAAWHVTLGLLLGLAVAALAALVVWQLRGRGVALDKLVERSPELHPAITYLVHSLRHELLKHRIGAAADALTAVARGSQAPEELDFLRTRLYGGQPLAEAWRGYLDAFERALGHRLDLSRDRSFRAAGRAIERIVALEPRVGKMEPRAIAELTAAHAALVAFDRSLAEMVRGLVRTRVDRALLEHVVAEVMGEYAPSQVALDELAVRDVEPGVEVEVFRVDLVLVLKNIVRNAILAVGRDGPVRRVALDVVIDLEATGEETVRIRVFDTSSERFSADMLLDRSVGRGLGLVAAAVHRYGGAIDVLHDVDTYQKAVCVCFFRAFSES